MAPVIIKSIDDLKDKLTRPAICEYVQDNFDDIEDDLYDVMYFINTKDGSVLLDRNCKITFLSLDILQEYIIYNSLRRTMESSEDLIITDNAVNKVSNIVQGAEHYLNTKKNAQKGIKNNEPCIIILEFENGKRDIYYGLPRYVKNFVGIV